jgi:type VI protein secretion system component Hcp
MTFLDYNGNYLKSESQVQLDGLADGLPEAKSTIGKAGAGNLFEIESFNFDVEQTLNIGSQSSGAGAGKITFNPFTINRKIDKSSPVFFSMACSGTPFKEVCLGLRKAAGGNVSGVFFLMFRFMLVAVKTVSWESDDESPKETVAFEYGGLQVFYGQQDQSGKILTTIPGGWNRVKNIKSEDVAATL